MKVHNTYIVKYEKSCQPNKLATLFSGILEKYYIQYVAVDGTGRWSIVLEKIDRGVAHELIKKA